jgi:hypothetical protein
MAGNDFAEKLVEQMDKAIAYDPEDSIFRVKKSKNLRILNVEGKN